MANSPIIWGPNNLAINLENGVILGNGGLVNSNGPKNYITYGNFENGLTTGWSLGTVGTLTNAIPTGTPTFGSGNSGNLSIAIVSAGQLSGNSSLSYVSSAATTLGDMLASQAYTIDSEDQAKVLTFKFYYSVFSGAAVCNFSGTSSNSFGVAIYDVTNSSWLTSTANFGMSQSTGSGICTGTCQTNATTASLRFVIYNANATAGGMTIYLDDIYLGPQTAPLGPVVTDWVAYTPTFSGFGTVSSQTFQSRRVGDTLQVHGVFVIGTPTAVANQITFGFNGANANVTADLTKVPGNALIGDAGTAATASATNFRYGILSPPSAGNSYVQLSQQSSTNQVIGATALGTSMNLASGNTIELNFMIPIVGWSANVQMSNDTDTRVVAGLAPVASTSLPSANVAVQLLLGTATADTHGGFSSNTYIVPVSGYYTIGAYVFYGSIAYTANATNTISYSINSASVGPEFGSVLTAGATYIPRIQSQVTNIKLNAGDVVRWWAQSGTVTSTVTVNAPAQVWIRRTSGPATIAATESVNMRYFSSSTTITGSLATIVFTTKDWDSHNAFNIGTGIYTFPVSGRYQVNASIAMTGTFVLNSILDLQVQQTGSSSHIAESKAYAGGALTQMNTNVGDIFYALAGDTLKIQASNTGTTPAIAATTTQNWISIARLGN